MPRGADAPAWSLGSRSPRDLQLVSVEDRLKPGPGSYEVSPRRKDHASSQQRQVFVSTAAKGTFGPYSPADKKKFGDSPGPGSYNLKSDFDKIPRRVSQRERNQRLEVSQQKHFGGAPRSLFFTPGEDRNKFDIPGPGAYTGSVFAPPKARGVLKFGSPAPNDPLVRKGYLTMQEEALAMATGAGDAPAHSPRRGRNGRPLFHEPTTVTEFLYRPEHDRHGGRVSVGYSTGAGRLKKINAERYSFAKMFG